MNDLRAPSTYPRKVKIEDSSNVFAVYYDPKTKEMAIQFMEGKRNEWYYYPGVLPSMFAALVSEESVGKTFHKLFKRNEGQPYEKVTR
jgi:hypothetical protein